MSHDNQPSESQVAEVDDAVRKINEVLKGMPNLRAAAVIIVHQQNKDVLVNHWISNGPKSTAVNRVSTLGQITQGVARWLLFLGDELEAHVKTMEQSARVFFDRTKVEQ